MIFQVLHQDVTRRRMTKEERLRLESTTPKADHSAPYLGVVDAVTSHEGVIDATLETCAHNKNKQGGDSAPSIDNTKEDCPVRH